MEGLSGFDRSMMKRLESSALAFYELKQPQQCEETQYRTQSVFAEAGKMKTTVKHQRRASDASSSSSSSSTSSSQVSVRQFSDATSDHAIRGRLSGQAVLDDDVKVTEISKGFSASTYGDSDARSPRPTTGPSNSSTGSISFSISRILGHDNTSPCRPGTLHGRHSAGRSTPPPAAHAVERTRSQSGMASPDSSCRVAGDDLDHDVKTLNDVNNDDADDLNDNDVMTQSPASAAAAIVCGDALHRLSWLQCTRYKPPKLPSKKSLSIHSIDH